jgi:hypothetical protein
MQHLLRTKRIYAAQSDALLKSLRPRANDIVDIAIAGLAAHAPIEPASHSR